MTPHMSPGGLRQPLRRGAPRHAHPRLAAGSSPELRGEGLRAGGHGHRRHHGGAGPRPAGRLHQGHLRRRAERVHPAGRADHLSRPGTGDVRTGNGGGAGANCAGHREHDRPHVAGGAGSRRWSSSPTRNGAMPCRRSIYGLAPKDDVQRALKEQATEMVDRPGPERWLLYEQAETSVSRAMLLVVILWLAVLFLSIGLFAPPNATVVVALMLSALSVSGAIFLILELDHAVRRADQHLEPADAPRAEPPRAVTVTSPLRVLAPRDLPSTSPASSGTTTGAIPTRTTRPSRSPSAPAGTAAPRSTAPSPKRTSSPSPRPSASTGASTASMARSTWARTRTRCPPRRSAPRSRCWRPTGWTRSSSGMTVSRRRRSSPTRSSRTISTPRAPRRRHRDHAVAQSTRGWRIQVQHDERGPGRHRRDPLDPGPRQRAPSRRQCGRGPRARSAAAMGAADDARA